MNKTQKRIISWAIVAFLFIGLYPPWIETHIRTSVSVGHHLIFDPPTSETPRRKGIEIDFKRLLVYWIMVIFVGGAMVLGNKSSDAQIVKEIYNELEGDNAPDSEKPVEEKRSLLQFLGRLIKLVIYGLLCLAIFAFFFAVFFSDQP